MWLIAINPFSGQGRGSEVGARVVTFFDTHDLPYQVFSAPNATALKVEIENFLDLESVSGVVCVGGDGLTHLILQLVVPRRIPFAPIPAGTGNDIVRSLGWSLDEVERQLRKVTSTPAQAVDLGNVDSEWFAAVLSTGFDSVVNERANRLRWPRGRGRYNAAIAFELPRFNPLTYLIETDSSSFQVEAMLIAVGNGKSYGGGMQICPQAQLHDGLFDITILEPVSKIEFLKVFPQVYSGSHVHHPKVRMMRSSKVKISASAIAYADGERIGPAPISAECVKGVGLTWTL